MEVPKGPGAERPKGKPDKCESALCYSNHKNTDLELFETGRHEMKWWCAECRKRKPKLPPESRN